MTKKMRRWGYNDNMAKVQDKEGRLLKNEEMVINRCIEYFEEIYSKQNLTHVHELE